MNTAGNGVRILVDNIHLHDKNEPLRILIIQTAFLGDVVLSTPLVQRLHEQFPGASIDYLTAPRGANVIETNPYLRDLLLYDKYGSDRGITGFFRWCAGLRKKRYDIALVLHRSLRSALLAWCAGIRVRAGFSNSAGAFLLNRRAEYRYHVHEIERNLALLSEIGQPAAGAQPRIFPSDQDEKTVNDFFEENGLGQDKKPVAVAPGSAWATKRWPGAYYAELVRRLASTQGRGVILFGSDEDIPLCRAIREESGGQVFIAAGRFTPRQSVVAMKRTCVLLTNDNGALHLGMAADVRTAAIFGPTVTTFGFAPYGEGHRVLELELECRPCGKHGSDKCPLKHFKCMKNLPVEKVYNTVLSMIEA